MSRLINISELTKLLNIDQDKNKKPLIIHLDIGKKNFRKLNQK